MRIRRNTTLGTWEMAESDKEPWQSVSRRPGKIPREVNRILIVDDEKSVQTVLRRVIAGGCPDFEIEIAENGKVAVEMFLQHHHGTIVLDLYMPVMDGEKAFREILAHCQKENWEIPAVVFCTGYDPPSGIRKAVTDDSIHCMLHKPVTAKTLLQAVKARL